MIRIITCLTSLMSAVIVGECLGVEPLPTFRVYWDVSHGVVDNYRPSGRYSVLVNHLAPLGFQFTEGNSPLDAVDLDPFDVLVLANGSFASTFPSSAEIAVVHSYVNNGGGLLIMSDIEGSSGVAKIQQFADLFGARVGLSKFPPDDVYSTRVDAHPSVAGVDQIYLRFSSTIDPGSLTSYVFYDAMPMLAAGSFGSGRIVLIADGDLFTYAPTGQTYFDSADNRQLADSVFQYLAVPEPSICGLAVIGVVLLFHIARLSTTRMAI